MSDSKALATQTLRMADPIKRAADDPSQLGWPVTLPIEIAMRERSPKTICENYEISRDRWNEIRVNPIFIKAVEQALADLRRDGAGFKVKARLQSEELLATSWNLIHSPNHEVSPSVKADLIKFTVRAAGLDGSKDQGVAAGGVQGTALQINIDLSSRVRPAAT